MSDDATTTTASDDTAPDEAVLEAELDRADLLTEEAVEVVEGIAAELTPEEITATDITATPADEAVAALAEVEGIDEADVLVEEEVLTEAPAPRPESPYDRPGRWYVLHTQSGYENKVRQNIEARTKSMNMESRIHEVVIPMQDVPEFNKKGERVVVQKKMFPGYLVVRCDDLARAGGDDVWYVIRNTPGVTGFVGAGNKPSRLSRRDVEKFIGVEPGGAAPETGGTKPPGGDWWGKVGEVVRVKEGPFADFSGEIVEINFDQARVKVLVNIFGRETPVELEFAQVDQL